MPRLHYYILHQLDSVERAIQYILYFSPCVPIGIHVVSVGCLCVITVLQNFILCFFCSLDIGTNGRISKRKAGQGWGREGRGERLRDSIPCFLSFCESRQPAVMTSPGVVAAWWGISNL